MIQRQSIFLFLTCLLLVSGCEQQALSGEQLFERQQYEAALEVFLPQAKSGDREAQNYLGMIYYMGLVGRRDLEKAEHWFAKAAKLKQPSAQLNYGMLIEQRAKEASEFLESYQWYYAAYENGNPRAERRIQHLLKNHRIFHNQRVFAQKQMQPYIDYSRQQKKTESEKYN